MAGSVNKVIIVGNLGADPEVKNFQNGGKIVNLRVACSESWKDKQTGERKERTEWVSVSIQNEGIAGVAEKYLRKGSKVYIEGALSTRKWQDQSGQDRYTTEVVLRAYNGQLVLLGGQQEGNGASGGRGRDDDRGGGYGGRSGGGYDQSPEGGSRSRGGSGGMSGGGGRTDMDDEIPF